MVGSALTGQVLFPALAERNSVQRLLLWQCGSLRVEHFEALAGATALELLSLTSCGLQTFPAVLLRLPRLAQLNLSQNPISVLPAGVALKRSFRQLDVSGCPIINVPEYLVSETSGGHSGPLMKAMARRLMQLPLRELCVVLAASQGVQSARLPAHLNAELSSRREVPFDFGRTANRPA
eukprot:TRINITY_DN5117_c0_g1_i4.p1 TRINITY_DN5117_c0_g1~~TRINITY_DN5117_c0_g1_i4.p1  ORF type:complete len:179 (-),score=38.46 TRINITY_DN5117_c0_g1_i4:67-603(-)